MHYHNLPLSSTSTTTTSSASSMNLQSYELPLGKLPPQQTRRKTPKIAHLLLIVFLLITIIPIYYPSLLTNNLKKLSQPSTSYFDGLNLLDSKIDESVEEKTDLQQQRLDESSQEETSNSQQSNTEDKTEGGIINESSPEENTEEKTEGGIINELPLEVTSNYQSGNTEEAIEAGIINEQRRDESSPEETTTYQPSNTEEKIEAGIIRDELPEGTTYQPSNTDEKLETGIINEPKHDELPEGRKRTGRKGRRRTGHRKKHPEQIGNKEIESNELLIKEKNIENSSSSSTSTSCDLFSGEWIPNPEGPYYTNETCWAIQEHQNCMKFGRPDREYLNWRWKPDGCELPIFDPSQFLELVRGKSLAFVGDSVARNHMQSLICLLSRVVYPEDMSKSINDQNRRYEYRDYNFTISMFWSPYLVKTQLTDPGNVTLPFNLYLDEFDPNWTTQIKHHNYVIISAGQWFMRPTYFYDKGKLVGCLYCPSSDKITYLTSYFSYRRAFRTAFKAINSLQNFNGVIYLRTFAPSHFEGGAWDKGGKCARKRPFKRNETTLEDYGEKMYKIQLEELEIGRRKGKKFRLFDATKAMLLRADGHPSKYGHWPQQKVELAEDCVHWCLPGPIDSWNDFLLQLLKKEQEVDTQ